MKWLFAIAALHPNHGLKLLQHPGFKVRIPIEEVGGKNAGNHFDVTNSTEKGTGQTIGIKTCNCMKSKAKWKISWFKISVSEKRLEKSLVSRIASCTRKSLVKGERFIRD